MERLIKENIILILFDTKILIKEETKQSKNLVKIK